MTIDDLLNNLHDGRLLTIDEQLRLIEREIAHRRLASSERSIILLDQIRELQEHIMRLLPEHEFAADMQRPSREPLERERRMLEREHQEEITERWRDMRDLKKEQRQLIREREETEQRYERHTGKYE